MKQYCFALDLVNQPQIIEQYEYYHQKANIWPEIVAGIKACGVHKMDIYRVGNRLLMIVELPANMDIQQCFSKMAGLPKQQEWANLMHTMQQPLPFAQPEEYWILMQPIFEFLQTQQPLS